MTPGGIFLPDQGKEKPQQGKVLAVGPGRRMEDGSIQPVLIKVDQVVLFPKHSGMEVKVRGIDYLILSEREVMATLEEE